MSGGSFNYLCFKDAEDLFGGNGLSDLEHAARELADEGAEDIAFIAQEILTIVRSQRHRVDARLKSIQPVLKELEWWRSCDSGEDQFHEAVAKWRAS